MDEGKARAELDRANRAKRIYEDELFKGAVEGIKEKLWDEFLQTPFSDDDTRKNIRIAFEMLDRICKSFRKHMDQGKIARRDLGLKDE